jgi:hypothetical protein
MFDVLVTVEVDNGRRALFWQDRWIEGCSLLQLAPNLVVAVPKRAHDHRSVVDALLCDRWISDISDSLSVTTLDGQVHKFQCKGFDTLFVLVGWSLWLEPNARVLNNKSLLAVQLAAHIRVEGLQWIAAGFSDLGDFIH